MFARESLVRDVLFRACRVDDRPGASWHRETDWPEVVERATVARVAAHLHLLVERQPAGVPPEIRQRLATLYRRQAADAVIIHEALREILGALGGAGIPVIVLKGAAMAAGVYQNVAVRPMRDLDLLVRERDLAAAEATLGGLGYAPDEWYQSREWYRSHLHHLVPLSRPQGPVPVEIHHHLTPPSAPVRLEVEQLWNRALPAIVAGSEEAWVLAPDDLLLHVCLHLTTDVPFLGGLGIVRDIAEVLRRFGDRLDRERLLRTTSRAGAVRHLYAALETARAVTGAPISPALHRATRQAAGYTWLGDVALRQLGRVALAPGAKRRLPPEALVEAFGHALVDPGGLFSRAVRLARAMYGRGASAGRARGFSVTRPLYAVLVHPFVVLSRFVRDRVDPPRTPDAAAPVGVEAALAGDPADATPSAARLRRADGVREYPLGDELLIYAPGGAAAHALNPSARVVWGLCDGAHTADDICRELAADLDRSPVDLAADVGVAIARFRELGLLAAE